ncbi:winged helix DNA-binding protein [Eubacteriales bacterium OttesenSCG-928-N13]|nr:winged helix DNA-binding protein [Eubacteriales bacterium OttesenSCG-928-N13]
MTTETERIYHAMNGMKKIHALIGRQANLPPGEFFVLERVQALSENQSEEVSISSLHNRDHMTLSAVSQTVAQLEKRGLVQRKMSEHDRRKTVVSITPEGKVLLETMQQQMDLSMAELMERFGKQEANQLAELMEKLAETIEQMLRERAAQGEEDSDCFD